MYSNQNLPNKALLSISDTDEELPPCESAEPWEEGCPNRPWKPFPFPKTSPRTTCFGAATPHPSGGGANVAEPNLVNPIAAKPPPSVSSVAALPPATASREPFCFSDRRLLASIRRRVCISFLLRHSSSVSVGNEDVLISEGNAAGGGATASSSLKRGIVPTTEEERISFFFFAFLSTPNRPPRERPRFNSSSSSSSWCCCWGWRWRRWCEVLTLLLMLSSLRLTPLMTNPWSKSLGYLSIFSESSFWFCGCSCWRWFCGCCCCWGCRFL